MADIPDQPNLTPEQAQKSLQDWYLEQQKLKQLKQHEHLLRTALAGFFFHDPREGTNRVDIGNGFDLKLQHGYNYKVAEEDLDNAKASDIKKLKLPWDDLFVYKPTLHIQTYRSLSAEQKKYVDQFLDIKEASPQLEIVPAADKAGQQKHIERAEAQKPKLEASLVRIVADPGTAAEGEYYTNGEGEWWVLLNGEWAACEPDICGELEAIRMGYADPGFAGLPDAPPVEIALVAEEAKPGQFHFDGDDWWVLMDSMEWDEVSPENIEALNLVAALEAAQATAKPKRGRGRKKKDS